MWTMCQRNSGASGTAFPPLKKYLFSHQTTQKYIAATVTVKLKIFKQGPGPRLDHNESEFGKKPIIHISATL